MTLAPVTGNMRTDPGISSVMSYLSVIQAVGSVASTSSLDLMITVEISMSKHKPLKKKLK